MLGLSCGRALCLAMWSSMAMVPYRQICICKPRHSPLHDKSLPQSKHQLLMLLNLPTNLSTRGRSRRGILVLAQQKQQESSDNAAPSSPSEGLIELVEDSDAKQKRPSTNRDAQRSTYLFAALASSVGITTLAAAAVYYRFAWQMQGNGEIPVMEMFGTFSLAFGAAVGMEFWARWAHKALWHASLWSMHESHHRAREGPFETNDVFAIINAVPAIALMSFGFFHKGFVPGLCFGAGLGITVFGIAYMFVHDGLVHRRFAVGPIADVPYFQKVAAAHQLHHADLFDGVPYGLFLGPKELEEVGGSEELERLLKLRKKTQKAEATK